MKGNARLVAALGLALLLAAPLVAGALAPHAGQCVLKSMVGVPCPGCGLGHGMLAAGGGDLLGALRHYPPLALLCLLYLLGLWALISRIAGRRAPRPLARSAQWAGSATAALVVIHWAITVATR